MASAKMRAHATTFKKYFSRKPALNALVLLNNVIPVFKKAKSLIIEPTVTFKKFTCLPAFRLTDGRMDSQPAISPGCARCKALAKQWLTASDL